MATEMMRRGHQVTVIAPLDSQLDSLEIIPVPGELQPLAQTQDFDTPIILPPCSVLANMWDAARQEQDQFDIILNFAYDWLPFYLTPFLNRPVAHLVSMASLNQAMQYMVFQTACDFQELLAFHSEAQAESFCLPRPARILGNGLDISLYEFSPHPDKTLAWVGRIAPEKALEDGIQAAIKAGYPLRIFGQIGDGEYWQKLQNQYPPEAIDYRGFLPTQELQKELGKCSALLVTPRWLEAFGNVCLEALACGVPVIAYRRGGPAEIVEDGKTGFLVTPDSIDGLVTAINRIPAIDRSLCRASAQSRYSLSALGDRLEQWFQYILEQWSCSTNDLEFERS